MFKLRKKVKDNRYKKIYLFLAISFIASLAADLIYNIVLNLFNFQYENTIIVSLFDIPFALFLLLQLIVLAYILFLNGNGISKWKNIFYTPNIILSMMLFASI